MVLSPHLNAKIVCLVNTVTPMASQAQLDIALLDTIALQG